MSMRDWRHHCSFVLAQHLAMLSHPRLSCGILSILYQLIGGKFLQEVVDFVAQRLAENHTPSEVASQLLDACLANDPADTRGIGCDNMTATIVVVRNLPSQHLE